MKEIARALLNIIIAFCKAIYYLVQGKIK